MMYKIALLQDDRLSCGIEIILHSGKPRFQLTRDMLQDHCQTVVALAPCRPPVTSLLVSAPEIACSSTAEQLQHWPQPTPQAALERQPAGLARWA